MTDFSRGPVSASERAFRWLCIAATVAPLAMLALLLSDLVSTGLGRLGWDFLTSFPSRKPDQAGILAGLVGTVALITIVALVAVPIGVGAAIYLEEYGGKGRFDRILDLNIANLAAVPSIIYGLVGLEIFVRTVGMGRSLLAGGLTLSLLVLPIVIISSREALRTVPLNLREAGIALGSTRWQTIRQVVLPSAAPGILTGCILALSRAIGEAAPLVVLGALTYVDFLPDGLQSPFTALPIQIFNWVSRPQEGFVVNAAAGSLVLVATLLALNGIAIVVRNRYQDRLRP